MQLERLFNALESHENHEKMKNYFHKPIEG